MAARPHSWLLAALLPLAACTVSPSGGSAAAPTPPLLDGGWRQYADVRQAGYDGEALRAVCAKADALRSGAVLVVHRGHVLLACGDVSRPFETHSVRKSLVSALYGIAIGRREVDPDATLTDYGIQERTSLTAAERSVTIRQLIAARSGVYLPAAYAPLSQDRRPARGSHAPGTHWFYNNWDFNVAGVVLERATQADLYAYFTQHLAEPLGMEDWRPALGFRVYEPTKSIHPAHTFRLSTRDLARVGQLYIQYGRWHGHQLLSASWIASSTRPTTDDGDGTGYGYMWWTYEPGPFTARYPHLRQRTFYRAWGAGDQGLWVFPDADLVVVHRTDTDHGRSVDGGDHWALIESILAARRGDPDPAPRLKAVAPTPLASQAPPYALPQMRSPITADFAPWLGAYRLQTGAATLAGRTPTDGGTVRVFVFRDMPFVHVPGVGDVQIFATGPGAFTTRAAPDLSVTFDRGANGTGRVTFRVGGRIVAVADAQPRPGPILP